MVLSNEWPWSVHKLLIQLSATMSQELLQISTSDDHTCARSYLGLWGVYTSKWAQLLHSIRPVSMWPESLDTPKGTEPLDTPKDTHPLDTPKDTEPLDTLKGTRPLDTLKGTRPLDTLKSTTPLDPLIDLNLQYTICCLSMLDADLATSIMVYTVLQSKSALHSKHSAHTVTFLQGRCTCTTYSDPCICR